MQDYGTPSLLYDDGFFGRSGLNFNESGPAGEHTISNSGLLGLSDTLDRLDTASSFYSGSGLQQALGESMAVEASAQDPSNEAQCGSIHSRSMSAPENRHQHHGQDSQFPSHRRHNSFGLDENGNLVVQDMLHHRQMPTGKVHDSHSLSMMDQYMSVGGGNEASSSPTSTVGEGLALTGAQGNNSNGVTSHWEESLHDLQSLLALHGQQCQKPTSGGQPDQQPGSAASTFINSGSSGNNIIHGPSAGLSMGEYRGLDKGHSGSPSGPGGLRLPMFGQSGNYPNAVVADSDLLTMLQNPSLQHQFQAPAGPVSAFPSNPGFRKGSGPSGPVNSSCTSQIPSPVGGRLYSGLPGLGATSYTSLPLLGPGYFGVDSAGGLGNLGNLGNFMSNSDVSGIMMPTQKQHLMGGTSMPDLEQAKGHCIGDNGRHGASLAGPICSTAAVTFPPMVLEAVMNKRDRHGSDGGLLLSGKGGSELKGINHFATERQRREYLNEKYQTLRSLVPNPSKADRASIVADAIEYVKELKRTVQELQVLVKEKRKEAALKEATAGHYCSTGAHKRRREADDGSSTVVGETAAAGGGGGSDAGASNSLGRSFSAKTCALVETVANATQMKSSWLQRISPTTGTIVDVRIVYDEVTVKITKRRKMQAPALLPLVIGGLHEMQLEVQHANGAHIGEHDVYLVNNKIMEGASTFSCYVVARLLETVDCD